MGIYKNVMELLVEEEVARQYKKLSARLSSYVNPTELVAYALNQLPSLYATSEKGLEYQLERGRAKYGAQITQAVQRALAAVSRDPLRNNAPLADQQSMPLREVLHQMRLLLKNDKVDWDSLPTAVEQALRRAARGGAAWEGSYSGRSTTASKTLHRSPFPTQTAPAQTASAQTASPKANDRAARATSETTNWRNASSEQTGEIFGWDDPLYNPR